MSLAMSALATVSQQDDQDVLKDVADRVSMLTARMTMREAFIASVFTSLPRTVGMGGTAATNGKFLYFGAAFCDKLTDDELFFVMMHEALHVVFMHMFRLDGRCPRLWNLACDAVINRMLIDKGYTMPVGGILYDWVRDEHDAEQVHRRLQDNPPPANPPPSDGSPDASGGGAGDPADGNMQGAQTGGGGWDGQGDMAPTPDSATELDVRTTIMTAARMAKAAGQSDAIINRLLDGDALKPSVLWADVLRRLMTSVSRDDYSWRRPNRRFMGQGVYMPSLHSPGIGGLMVSFDTSGSMTQPECNQVAREIQAIAEDTHPEWVEVIYHNSGLVGTPQRFERGEDIVLKAKGGGGTSFRAVFDHVNACTDRVAALVLFTDMCGDQNAMHPPSYPVVWACTDGVSRTAPFGDVTQVIVDA